MGKGRTQPKLQISDENFFLETLRFEMKITP
jgi:hypothetical protein